MSQISTTISSISDSNDAKNSLSLTLKINLIGDSNVGKTSIIHQFIKKTFINSVCTIGIECYRKKIKIEEYIFNLNIWDTAGQEIYRNLTKNSIRGVDILMLVFDVTNRNTFNNLEYWYNEIKNIIDLNTITFCLIANKIDLVEKQQVFYEEYYKYSNLKNAQLFETNAKDYNLVNQVFENSVESYYIKFLKENTHLGNFSQSYGISLTKEKNKKVKEKTKTKCC